VAVAPALVSPQLREEETKARNELRNQLAEKEKRNALRSAYYDGKRRLEKFGISIPAELRDVETVIGWPAKTVDVLEQRLNFEDFVLPEESSLLDDLSNIDADNRMELERSQAHVSALIHGTSFVFVTAGDTSAGEPEVIYSIRSARQATAIYNRRARRLDAALEVVEGPENALTEILYLPDRVLVMERDQNGAWQVDRRENPTGRVLCAPIIHRPFIERKFGMSRITRPVMSWTDMGVRTVMRTEVSAEFYSSPQRYAIGVDENAFADKDGKIKTGWETVLGRIWAVPHGEVDEETGVQPHPTAVGQFPQMTMQPNIEHLREIATMFAGETSIPVSYLGIIHDNPASADAINAGEADLNKVAERDHVSFGAGWVHAAQLAIMLRDGSSEIPEELRLLKARWGNPATPTRQAAAQSVMSLVSTGVFLPRSEITWEQLGLDQPTIDRLKLEEEAEQRRMQREMLLQAASGASPRAQQLGARQQQLENPQATPARGTRNGQTPQPRAIGPGR
jgi:hypothetical protein